MRLVLLSFSITTYVMDKIHTAHFIQVITAKLYYCEFICLACWLTVICLHLTQILLPAQEQRQRYSEEERRRSGEKVRWSYSLIFRIWGVIAPWEGLLQRGWWRDVTSLSLPSTPGNQVHLQWNLSPLSHTSWKTSDTDDWAHWLQDITATYYSCQISPRANPSLSIQRYLHLIHR